MLLSDDVDENIRIKCIFRTVRQQGNCQTYPTSAITLATDTVIRSLLVSESSHDVADALSAQLHQIYLNTVLTIKYIWLHVKQKSHHSIPERIQRNARSSHFNSQ